ncbi:MAG: FAD-binding oxidoreductase [Alphaproteobacteria bacterium]|nr:FAD-binding oxidoreductase [Alphaproteobacteria bacterium]
MEFDPLKSAHPGQGLAHPESYWAATAGTVPSGDGAVAGDIEAEIAIVGGGYTGLSCAYHLARNYGARPVVLEANRAGWGCSGRNGSFVRPGIGRRKYHQWVEDWGVDAARALFAEALAGVGTVRGLIRDGNIECDVQSDGWLKIAHRQSRVADLERDRQVLNDLFGFKAELLDPEAIAAGHFRGKEAWGALRAGGSFGMHPLKLANGIARMAQEAGAVLHEGSPVTDMTRDGGMHVLTTPGGRVRARIVVLAVNGYGPELHRATRGRVLPVLSNIVVTRPMTAAEKQDANFVTSDVMFDTRTLLNYFRLLPDDRILLGNRGPLRDAPATQARHRDELLAAIHRKFPALRAITADYFWGGWVAVSLDSMPHVTTAEDDPSLFYGMGYCGTGVSAAIQMGRRLAERIGGGAALLPVLDTVLPRMPLAAFRRLGQAAMFRWFRWRDERG